VLGYGVMDQVHSKLFPGGVNSPVRALQAVGGGAFEVASARGAHLYSTEGKQYIDYVGGFGPAILGHAHPAVVSRVQEALSLGISYGATNDLELVLAAQIQHAMPHLERLRFVNSGTEAAMTAIRLARAATKRSKIIKCDGCYHGHADALLVAAGSGVATLGLAGSKGVPSGVVADTLSIPFNDLAALEACFKAHPEQIAAFIVEPIPANMGLIFPLPAYLAEVRRLCSEHGVVLIFDEVLTGFRVAWGGAQSLYGVQADLTLLGKVIGGGLPIGAVAGKAALLDLLAPCGPVYQAGTLSGNRLSMACGIQTLLEIQEIPEFYEQLASKMEHLFAPIKNRAMQLSIPLSLRVCGGLFGLAFSDKGATNYAEAQLGCPKIFTKFFQYFLAGGIYWPPSQFEVGFISHAHNARDMELTLDLFYEFLRVLHYHYKDLAH
jgi:glutamate-1-semialdehyde 2,1-aminomutase